MAVNKVTFDSATLIDLSTDTVVSANDIASGKVGHLNDGTVVTGTAATGGGTDGVFYPIKIYPFITVTAEYNGGAI